MTAMKRALYILGALVLTVTLGFPTTAYADPPADYDTTLDYYYEDSGEVLVDRDTCTFERTITSWIRERAVDPVTGDVNGWGPWVVEWTETETWGGTIDDPYYVLEPGEEHTEADCPWLSVDPDPVDGPLEGYEGEETEIIELEVVVNDGIVFKDMGPLT